MAVVLRLPDRAASGPKEAVRPDTSAEILILPCIRRETIERKLKLPKPTRDQQLQA